MVQIGYTVPKERMFRDHRYLSGTTKSLSRHFSEVCEKIEARQRFAPDDYALDIGGNDGTFLTSLRDHGIGVLNVDSGTFQAEISNRNGIPCINAFFDAAVARDIRQHRGAARVVHGSGIFFHLEDLHSVFDGIRHVLADDGLLVAEFIYLPSMVRACAFDQIYHEHLLYYTAHSFSNVLEQHGLEIYDAELVPIHGGSCIAYIGHKGRQPRTERLVRMLAAEEEDGYNDAAVYREFAARAAVLRDRLAALVRDARRAGKSIQALGAPVKGTTIIHYCGFSEQDLDCAVEINEFKCDTWYPGTRIPVLHQDAVKPPDLYLMLSWNFRDEILERLSDYRERGGKVLVPIPAPVIV